MSSFLCRKKQIARDHVSVYGAAMTDWKAHLTETEAESLAQWESDMQSFKDQTAIYVVWKRRLADKVRARIRKAKLLERLAV